MNNIQQDKTKSKHSCLGVILTTIVFLLVVGGLFWYYFPHLSWKYFEMTSELHHVGKISNRLMPVTDFPEDWVEHSLGCMRFRLPPDMSPQEYPEESFGALLDTPLKYSNGNILVSVHLDSNNKPIPFLRQALRVFPEENFLTLTQLCLKTFEVEPSDFSWSMSRQEAFRFVFLITLREVIMPSYVESTESFSGKNWEGFMGFGEAYRGFVFQWESSCCFTNDRYTGGFISLGHVGSEQGIETLDINVIRGIIQSMEVNCSCNPVQAAN